MTDGIIVTTITEAFRLGTLDALIPFVIIYTILYVLFDRAQVLGKNKVANIVLSLAISALVAFSPAGTPIIQIFRQIFSSTAILLVFVIIFVVLAFLIGVAKGGREGGREPWLLIVAAIATYYILVKSDVLRFLGLPLESFPIPNFIFVLLGVIAVILLIIRYMK